MTGLNVLANHVALVLVELRITALTLELAVQRSAEKMLKLVDCSVAERPYRFLRCFLVDADMRETTKPIKCCSMESRVKAELRKAICNRAGCSGHCYHPSRPRTVA